MRKLVILGSIGMALMACSKSDSESRAEFIAAGVNAIAPKSLGDGLSMTAARAEKSTLILSFAGVAPEEMALPDFDHQMRQVICADPNFSNVISKGVDIGLDLSDGNGNKANVMVESC